MRWGSGKLNWVRPLRSIVATFGPETEEPVVVPNSTIDGIKGGDDDAAIVSRARRDSRCAGFDDTLRRLAKGQGRARRGCGAWTIIRADAKNLRFRAGLSNWSRMKACSPKSPAWSNGRSC